jgi:uncharacterized protein YbbC (DUF1343 family)
MPATFPSLPLLRRAAMALALVALAAAPPAIAAPPPAVRTGLDVLAADRPDLLRGKRVGLVTNMSAIDRAGRSAIDRIAAIPGVKLAALFAPEHGLRADLDMEGIPDGKDRRTGAPVFSLYGKHRAPTPAQLAKLDVLVYDIQDVGARFYTYSTTLGLCLEAAAKARKPFVVLDRPNPITGVSEGEVLDPAFTHFTGRYRLPIRHGLTMGELARLIDGEAGLHADLTVVAAAGWRRAMWFDQTGLPWRRPSPAMGDPETALYYVGIGMFEGTNVNCRAPGRPFRWVGARWADGAKLAATATAARLPGVRFTRDRNGDQDGVAVAITDRRAFRPLETAVVLLAAFKKHHPTRFDPYRSGLGHMSGSDALWTTLRAGGDLQALFGRWRRAADAFDVRRKPYLLYE